MEAWTTAEYAVQDSLRQVALVMQLLQTLQPWCGHPQYNNNNNDDDKASADCFAARLETLRHQQLVHLWVTVASAFLERSHVTTVFNYKLLEEEEDQDNDLGYRHCHLCLQLAEMVLSSSSSSTPAHTMSMSPGNSTAMMTTTSTNHNHNNNSNNNQYETSLCLTFLRGLDYPELLGMADTLWHELERRMLSLHHCDLQQMLRAAVLTLRKQYLLPIVVVDDDGDDDVPVVDESACDQKQLPSRHQRRRAGAHTIVQRLLPLLWTAAATATTKDPWDGFFWRQSAGLIANHYPSEGEGRE